MLKINRNNELTNAVNLVKTVVAGKPLKNNDLIGAREIKDFKTVIDNTNNYLQEQNIDLKFLVEGRMVTVESPETLREAIDDLFPLVGDSVYGNYTLKYCWMTVVQGEIDKM